MSNIFFSKIMHKIPWRHFSQTPKIEHIFGSIVSIIFLQLAFTVCQVDDNQNIFKLSCRSFALTSYKTFPKKQKKVWNQSLCLNFSMIFEEKCFSCYILMPELISLSDCLYFGQYILGNISICGVKNFEMNLIVLIKPVFLHGKKSTQKFKCLENEQSF